MKYEELQRAVEIIKRECLKHPVCVKCPLQFATCMDSTPDEWKPGDLIYEAEEDDKNE